MQNSKDKKPESKKPEPNNPIKEIPEKEAMTEIITEKPKKLDLTKQEDDKSNAGIDKFLLSIMKMKKEAEGSKIPSFITEKLNQEKQDFFRLNLNDFDLKLVNSIFSRRDDDINRELKNLSFDIDFGIYDFQRKFYARYVLLRYEDGMSETDKANNLEIKVSLSNSNHIYLTRSRLDLYLTKFRKIFASYCQIRSFLSEKATQKFDERFDFEIFLIIEEEVNEYLVIEESFNSFSVKWKSQDNKRQPNLKMVDDINDPILTEDYFKSYLISLFKSNMFTAVKTVTGIMDLSNEKVSAIMIRDHHELFEYFLKNQKLMNLGSIATKTNYHKWKGNMNVADMYSDDGQDNLDCEDTGKSK